MGKILEKITELAEKECITIGALERKIGASKGVLSRAIANGTDIQAKWLECIVENYPLVSAEWLLRGEGNMTRRVGDATVPAASPAVPEPSSPAIVSDLVAKIAEQAEEIGQLKERIFQLERKKGKGVSDALISGGASAG